MTKSENKKLLKIWGEKVFENAGNKCEITDTTADNCQLHPHHYFGRRNRATKYYIPNVVCLSAVRHTLGVMSAHENPEWFRKEMLDIRGDKWLTDLIKQSNKVFKGTYQDVLDYLEGKKENYC